MKKGVFIKGKLKGYYSYTDDRRDPSGNPNREVKGGSFKAEGDVLEVSVWNATYTFNGDGTVTVTPHEQLTK